MTNRYVTHCYLTKGHDELLKRLAERLNLSKSGVLEVGLVHLAHELGDNGTIRMYHKPQARKKYRYGSGNDYSS